MAYFVGDDGKQYFPFGRGGRENLLKGCGVLQQHSSAHTALAPSPAKGCGSHAPHEHSDACGGGDGATAGAALGKVESGNESFQRLQVCPLHSLPLFTHDAGAGVDGTASDAPLHSALPICVTDPGSPSAGVYAALARDVVLEVFKNQVSALLVSRLGHVAVHGMNLPKYPEYVHPD